MEKRVDDWLETFADEVGSDKSEVANRAIKVYATKLSNGTWKDPKFKDKYDSNIDNLT